MEGGGGGHSSAAEIVVTLHLEFVFIAEFFGFLGHSVPFFPTQDFNSLLQNDGNSKTQNIYSYRPIAEICNNVHSCS